MFGFIVFNPKKVNINLIVLAQSAMLWALIAPEVGQTIPTQRIGQLLAAGGNHAADARRHFRPQSHSTAAAVGKYEGLLHHDFLAGFAHINFYWLDYWRVVLLVAKALHDLPQVVKHPFLKTFILRIKIARTFVGLGR